MSRSLTRERLAIDLSGIGICIAVVALAYFLVFGPLLHQQSDVLSRKRALAAQRQKIVSAQATVRQLKQQLTELHALAPREALQPDKTVRINSVLEQITSRATTLGLEIKGMEPGVGRQESQYQVIPLRLTGSGDFRGCMRFIGDVHRSLRDTTVVAFQLTGTPEAAGKINFNFDLCWYTAPSVASAQD